MTYVAPFASSQPRVSWRSDLAGVEGRGLALDLVGDGALDRPERVHVLDLGPGAERLRAAGAQRDVRLDPHLAVLHLRVGDVDGAEQQPELLGIAASLLGGSDVRLGDDLHERDAERLKSTRLTRLPSAAAAWTSFAVSSSRWARRIPIVTGPLGRVEGQRAVGGEREVVLADLVALREVRVEVVLAIPARGRGRSRPDRGPGRQDVLHGLPVDCRERARQAEADRTGMGVRGGIRVRDGAGAEHLAHGPDLAVDLDPDHGLVTGAGGHAGVPRRLACGTPCTAITSRLSQGRQSRAERRRDPARRRTSLRPRKR